MKYDILLRFCTTFWPCIFGHKPTPLRLYFLLKHAPIFGHCIWAYVCTNFRLADTLAYRYIFPLVLWRVDSEKVAYLHFNYALLYSPGDSVNMWQTTCLILVGLISATALQSISMVITFLSPVLTAQARVCVSLIAIWDYDFRSRLITFEPPPRLAYWLSIIYGLSWRFGSNMWLRRNAAFDPFVVFSAHAENEISFSRERGRASVYAAHRGQ